MRRDILAVAIATAVTMVIYYVAGMAGIAVLVKIGGIL